MSEPHTGEWRGESVLPVSVITTCSGETNRPRNWAVGGVVVGERFASDTVSCLTMRSGPEGELYLWKGFSLRLRPAQANDYALNINTPHPSIYVVADRDESGRLRPLSTTVSLDEAQNLDATDLRDAGQQVFSVAMPPEVYRWVEHFVLDHYQPKQRKFRGKRRSKALFDAEVGDWAGED
jgi:hypothetical protein